MHESIDDVIARFEAVRAQAYGDTAVFNMPIAAIARMPLEAMRTHRSVWSAHLGQFNPDMAYDQNDNWWDYDNDSMDDHEGFPVGGHYQSYSYETENGDDTDTGSV